ncbi:MAG TPA: MaoC/PaaZ C-terminal domain-containing protein [Burkholderiaceae bacterium]|nr:MaoC/PaaZ C-terminal domain-containing protein [Burkholderiaceae bacterium]
MLEPVLEFSDLPQGRVFAPVPVTLDDGLVDAYLSATGMHHALLRGPQAGVPMSLMTMVRYSKTAIAGRWPSGTVQLDQRMRSLRALRRGETVSIEYWVANAEVVGDRPYFELAMRVRDAHADVIGESSGRSLWGGPVGQARAASAVQGRRAGPEAGEGAAGAQGAQAAGRALGAQGAGEAETAGTQGAKGAGEAAAATRIGPLCGSFSMDRLRAFGEVAAARDPIHLDPEFARTTRYGRNIAQGRLAMTLLEQLLLDHFGPRWLERGWMTVRFRRPVFVDQPLQAWAIAKPDTPGIWRLSCRNPEGDEVIEGEGGIG